MGGWAFQYKIKGKIKNLEKNPLSGLFVTAYDSDIGTDDFLGTVKTDPNGQFEITFSSDNFASFFDRRPDIYLVIRDEFRILHKTEIRSESGDQEVFEITISHESTPVDLYTDSMQRLMASFNSIGDTIDLPQADLQNLITQMIRGLSSWTYYTNPTVMKKYGYPGPQVPRYPKKVPDHNHSIPWRRPQDQ